MSSALLAVRASASCAVTDGSCCLLPRCRHVRHHHHGREPREPPEHQTPEQPPACWTNCWSDGVTAAGHKQAELYTGAADMDWNASILGVDVGRSWWLTSLGSLRHRSPFVEICKLGASAQADAPAPGGLSPRVTVGFNFKPAEVACSARICTASRARRDVPIKFNKMKSILPTFNRGPVGKASSLLLFWARSRPAWVMIFFLKSSSTPQPSTRARATAYPRISREGVH